MYYRFNKIRILIIFVWQKLKLVSWLNVSHCVIGLLVITVIGIVSRWNVEK